MFPQVRRSFQVTRCNQCENPPCVAACPTAAMYQRGDGIVDFDKSICIGCKACIAACPYDAIFINPDDLSAEKCNFCAHRLEVGLEPACVVVCPTEAIMVGNLADPNSKVAQLVQRNPVQVRRPELGTGPKLFYKGAHEETLDPLAARRPEGDTYAFSQIPRGAHLIEGGNARTTKSSAAALLSYDVGHSSPWGWRVSLYTWTKSLAAGCYLVALLFALGGLVSWRSPELRLAGPSLALVMLGITGLLLIWDLTHPLRFYLLFTHPQWRSWLVRGGLVIAGYGVVLLAQLGAGLTGATGAERAIAIIGIPLAALTAVYTAFLFAQAKGRDLWQSPLLAPMLLVQSLLAGSAALLLVAAATDSAVTRPLSYALAGAALVELLLQASEVLIGHRTEHARLAVSLMLRGRLGWAWWMGSTLVLVGLLAPVIGWSAGALALLGLLGQEHAYVQAGQAVPLA